MENFKDLLTVADAAKFLNLSVTTIRQMSNSKILKTYRHPVNKFRYYKQEDLQKFKDKWTEGNSLKIRKPYVRSGIYSKKSIVSPKTLSSTPISAPIKANDVPMTTISLQIPHYFTFILTIFCILLGSLITIVLFNIIAGKVL